MATELDKARAEAAISQLEESLKRGALSAQQIDMLEKAQTDTPFGYDPTQSSPEAVNYVTMYHNLTGEPHPTPEYMIRNFLTRKFPRENWIPQDLWGKNVYSLEPNDKYHVPEVMCWLSKDSDRRKEFEALGIYTTCEKGSGFNNVFEIEAHMRSAHRREFQAHKDNETRREQQEMLELQRALLKAQLDSAPRSGGTKANG